MGFVRRGPLPRSQPVIIPSGPTRAVRVLDLVVYPLLPPFTSRAIKGGVTNWSEIRPGRQRIRNRAHGPRLKLKRSTYELYSRPPLTEAPETRSTSAAPQQKRASQNRRCFPAINARWPNVLILFSVFSQFLTASTGNKFPPRPRQPNTKIHRRKVFQGAIEGCPIVNCGRFQPRRFLKKSETGFKKFEPTPISTPYSSVAVCKAYPGTPGGPLTCRACCQFDPRLIWWPVNLLSPTSQSLGVVGSTWSSFLQPDDVVRGRIRTTGRFLIEVARQAPTPT